MADTSAIITRGKRKRDAAEEDSKDSVAIITDETRGCDTIQDFKGSDTPLATFDLSNFAQYDPRTPELKAWFEQFAQDLERVLKDHKCDTKDVCKMRAKVADVLYVPEVKIKTIGFVGNQGTGKSSNVTSLIGIPNLAPALSIGKSVTACKMLYCRASREQSKLIAVSLVYCDPVGISTILLNAINDWRNWRELQADEDEDDLSDNFLEAERRGNAALSMFLLVFRGEEGFDTEEEATSAMDVICHTERSQQKKLTLLEDKVKVAMNNDNGAGLHGFSELSGVRDFHAWLGENVSTSSPMYPFIKEVIVRVKGSRILDHYIIADFPGLGDVDLVRVNATLSAMNSCQHLWFFGRIDRISSDADISRLVRKYSKVFRGKIAVIGTKSDQDISPSLVAAYAEQGMPIEGIELLRPTDDEYGIKIVRTRNAYATKEVRENFKRFLPNEDDFAVFCISSLQFDARKAGRQAPTPSDPAHIALTLPIEDTGVPAQEYHALSSAAPIAFKKLVKYVDKSLNAVVLGLKGWTEKDTNGGSLRLPVVIRRPEKEEFDTFKKELKVTRTQVVITALRDKQAQFVTGALKAVQNHIQDKPWPTIRAFARKNGSHKTSVTADSWNQLMTSGFCKVMESFWFAYIDGVLSDIEEFCARLISITTDLRNDLEDDPAAVVLPTEIFYAQLDAYATSMRLSCESIKTECDQALRAILLNVINDGPDNYFAKAMRPAYEACSKDRGSGYKDRCLNRLRERIQLSAKKSPFHIMLDSIEKAADFQVDARIERLWLGVNDTFTSLAADFDSLTSRTGYDISELALRDHLREHLSTKMPEFERHKQLLEQVKRDHDVEVKAWEE